MKNQDLQELIYGLSAKIIRLKRAKLDDEEEYGLGKITLSELRSRAEMHDKEITKAEDEIRKLRENIVDSFDNLQTLSSSFFDKVYTTPATPTFFYQGTRPTWRDILENNDGKRQGQEEVINLLTSSSPPYVLSILGLPGSGKSTFLRRIGYELYLKNHTVIIHRDAHSKELNIAQIERVYQELKKPIYLLIDDAFRLQSIQTLLNDLAEYSTPVYLLIASRFEEYEDLSRLNIRHEKPVILDATVDGALLFHDLINRGKISISADLQQVLADKVNLSRGYLILVMLEVIGGRGHVEIIRERIESLKDADLTLYQVFRYVCSAYRLGVSVPVSLLERLNNLSSLYDEAMDTKHARGLLYYSEAEAGYVEAPHEYFAQLAYENTTGSHPDRGLGIYLSIIENINPFSESEKKFLTSLLSSLVKSDKLLAKNIFSRSLSTVKRLYETYTIFDLIAKWIPINEKVGDQQNHEFILKALADKSPESFADFMALTANCSKANQVSDTKKALRNLSEYLYRNPQESSEYTSDISHMANSIIVWFTQNEISDARTVEAIITISKVMSYDGLIRENVVRYLEHSGHIEDVLQESKRLVIDFPDRGSSIALGLSVLFRYKQFADAEQYAKIALEKYPFSVINSTMILRSF